ncbi:MAG: permease [Actinobacteria bacterium]|nr:permease [Actinomycetota bacterium]
MSAGWRFVVSRARTQSAVLLAVLVVLVAGTTLLGTCALLLTTAQADALTAALADAAPGDVEVSTSLDVVGGDPATLVADATRVIDDTLAPLGSTTSTWLTSTMLSVPGSAAEPDRQGYLASAPDLADHARLTAGRWPRGRLSDGSWETAVPEFTAQQLGLGVGSRVELGGTPGQPAGPPVAGTPSAVSVVVVGTFAPTVADAAWSRDVLDGAGYAPSWEKPGTAGWVTLPTYGPFVVDPSELLGAPGGLAHLSLVARPDLTGATPATLGAVRASLATASRDLAAALSDRVSYPSVASELPRTLDTAASQQRVTRSGVLVLALMGAALVGAALGLAGMIVSGRRRGERELLIARGAGRTQEVAAAAGESLVLALVSAAVAAPLSVALYQGLTRVPLLAHAGITGHAAVTSRLVLSVLAGSLLLASVLVVPAIRSADRPARARSGLRGRAARSGADLLLLGLATVSYLQLRDHTSGQGGGVDPVLVAAPVLCLAAVSVIALRVVPWVARGAERYARRSRRLVVPLAAWEVARRPQSTVVGLLLVLGTAAATFGVSFDRTWSASQTDQADARVGTAFSVDLAPLPTLAQGAALADGTVLAGATGGAPAPVTHRAVGVGAWSDSSTTSGGTWLVGADTTRASTLLRGRLPAGQTWAGLTAGLAPSSPVPAVPIASDADGVQLTITGTASAGERPLRLVPTVIVQDEWGGRAPLVGPSVSLDGQSHLVTVPFPSSPRPIAAGLTVVGVDLRVTAEALVDPASRVLSTPLSVTAEIRGQGRQGPSDAAQWAVSLPTSSIPSVTDATVTAASENGVTTVTTEATLATYLLSASPAELMLTPFAAPQEVPVVVSEDLARATGSGPGTELGLTIGSATVRARVVATAPYVPSAVGHPAILADEDLLSRAVLTQLETATLTDVWWLGTDDVVAGTAERVRALGLGEPVSAAATADGLSSGPLRVGIRVALGLLVVAAVVLVVAGTVLHTVSSLEARSVEIARLLGIGIPRRAVVASIAVQHAAVNLLVVGAGAVAGGAVAIVVGPHLAVSETGQVPVPVPVPVMPWAAEAVLVAGLLVVLTAVVVPVAHLLVRRAGAAHLRLDGTS